VQDVQQSRDQDRADRVMERLAAWMTDNGMARMPARVCAAIFTAPGGALTAADIAERLRVSPAAVSSAVRLLTQIGLLHREHVPGSRRDRYRMRDDPWSEMLGVRGQRLRALAAVADEGVDALGGEGARDGARLAELRDFALFAEEEIAGIVSRWHARRAVRRTPGS
jgi:hypothetical protein